jgi:hypothetical protein
VKRWLIAAVLGFAIGGCRDSTKSSPSDVVVTSVASLDAHPPVEVVAVADAGAIPEAAPVASPLVVLRWREVERRARRDARGNEHWSVELELLVQGGTPSRVRLGRRLAYGFNPMPPEGTQIASVQSYMDAHGEYAAVTRPRPAELRVEAHGQDEALPGYDPPLTEVRKVTVRIPADAGVTVDETVEDPEQD